MYLIRYQHYLALLVFEKTEMARLAIVGARQLTEKPHKFCVGNGQNAHTAKRNHLLYIYDIGCLVGRLLAGCLLVVLKLNTKNSAQRSSKSAKRQPRLFSHILLSVCHSLVFAADYPFLPQHIKSDHHFERIIYIYLDSHISFHRIYEST